MPIKTKPAAEFSITEALVSRLLRAQHPDLTSLPLRFVASGWDSAVFRLGAQYAVRLPRRRMSARVVEHEIRWLPQIVGRLPLPIPVPLRVGVPSEEFPWSWTVVPWLPGSTAFATPPHDAAAAARTLGNFVAAMGSLAPADAPTNGWRGVALADRHTRVVDRIDHALPPEVRQQCHDLWNEGLAAPVWEGPPVWVHGDLHPANLIVDDGAISAVIDFSDLTSGDPAGDLSVAWMMFGKDQRTIFRNAAGGCDDATWVRARTNALAHAAMCLGASSDDPVIAAIGQATLASVLADTA